MFFPLLGRTLRSKPSMELYIDDKHPKKKGRLLLQSTEVNFCNVVLVCQNDGIEATNILVVIMQAVKRFRYQLGGVGLF